MMKRLIRIFLVLAVMVIVGLVGAGVYVYRVMNGSLPQLDGTVRVAGIDAPIRIERDAQGIPTIYGQSLRDQAYAIGYLHGQDRFFQMDILRRVSSGELAEIVGPMAVDNDRANRIHQFRKRAQDVLAAASEEERSRLDDYAAGVNAGLVNLSAKPIEYYVLGLEPRSWVPEDTVLCVYTMFLDLQEDLNIEERVRHAAYGTLPKELADFLTPRGSKRWDAPIVGEALDDVPIPGADIVNLRDQKKAAHHEPVPSAPLEDEVIPGSNNWAVAGKFTKHGGAIVADDMHLGLRVPNIWYRLSLVFPKEVAESEEDIVATGVSLPGAPSLVVGSNGHVAWGFTNAEGDWSDIIIVESEKTEDGEVYQTPDGPKPFDVEEETILVKGEDPVTLTVQKTIWGPVVGRDYQDRPLALRWVAHDTEGVNLKAAMLPLKTTLEDAIEQANGSGSPANNFTIADNKGRVAWSIIGRIPTRTHDGWLPTSWASGENKWTGYLAPKDYPKVIDPENGRIWTANARVAGEELLEKVGFGGYDLGARQQQIRDALVAKDQFVEQDMLAIQLDDRALFWNPWQELMLRLLEENKSDEHPLREQGAKFVEDWGGRAAIESVGYRLVHDFQLNAKGKVLSWLTEPCREADSSFNLNFLPKSVEGSLWSLVDQQPMNLLDPQYESWDAFLLTCIDEVLAKATENAAPLEDYTWGAYNTLRIEHPLAAGLRAVMGEDWVMQAGLNMPNVPVPGGARNMPRIARPNSGASQRMAVSPGREKEGYFHMPTGQSGHPFSPYYRAGHEDWVQGNPSRFLPGETAHTLILEPKSE